ncbi:hypothetical protein RRG08_027748 [Elysia crispata]|uniref:EGF-like domain-containing protein n=1 Tax=Elysia crispata TaxID=231223 RepID=A0AAE1CVJ6_9GAST|nr:hypothetical protein RRG08_027748 [Elysia crispata]
MLGTFLCECKDGYSKASSLNCADINECKGNTDGKRHNCSSSTKCDNLPGSFRCECHDGYIQVDSFTCKDIDECQKNNVQTLHNCTFNTACENLPGSFRCTCPDGYRLTDKLYCRAIIPEMLAYTWGNTFLQAASTPGLQEKQCS